MTTGAAQAAEDLAAVAVRAAEREAKKDPAAFARWGSLAMMFGALCALTYLLVRDARVGHGITAEEFHQVLTERDAKLSPATDRAIGVLADKLSGMDKAIGELKMAVSTSSAERSRQEADLRREVGESEGRVRAEVRATNERIDRLLERLPAPGRAEK